MEMEEKNSGSTCERFLGAVRRSLVHSAQFLQMGVLLSNEERDVEGMVSLKKILLLSWRERNLHYEN